MRNKLAATSAENNELKLSNRNQALKIKELSAALRNRAPSTGLPNPDFDPNWSSRDFNGSKVYIVPIDQRSASAPFLQTNVSHSTVFKKLSTSPATLFPAMDPGCNSAEQMIRVVNSRHAIA